MKVFVCALFDAKMKLYLLPRYFVTLGQAERWFGDEVNNQQTDLFKHPEDFSLFHVAMFDDEIGLFENLNAPQMLISALQVKKDNS